MHIRTKFLMAVLTAALALTAFAGTATALRSLQIEGERRIDAQGRVTFTSTEGGTRVQCNVTLTRTIVGSIAKRRGEPRNPNILGRITGIRTGFPEANCRSSLGNLEAIRILGTERAELWTLEFDSIGGTLPNITEINKIIRNVLAEFEVEIFGVHIRCLYEEEEGRRGGAAIETVEARERHLERLRIGANTSSRVRGSGSCPERGSLSGELTFVRGPIVRLV
jgi:hypothetical protein